ncbi:MAG TPA: DUF4097 family beta strand repeat-containing protein [Candidatus Eisenbacteria bacterium]|nr:DUF4097 family beta strand repeat-containing protein [Candidatus Eisenbacteria bacterium]
MIAFLGVACLVAGMATGTSFDTTIAVRPGARLTVNNFEGAIHVSSWARNLVKIGATHAQRASVMVDGGPVEVEVRSVGRMGVPGMVDYDIVVPRWMDLKLQGVTTGMRMEGMEGDVEAATVNGGIQLVGGRGFVHLAAVQGGVEVRDARGRLEVNAVNDDVHLDNVAGEVSAEAVNGDLVMERVDAASVEGETVNGSIHYSGALRAQGRYRFATHNGDITVVLPRDPDASVSVSTFSGEFVSSLPVQISDTRRGRNFNFVLGHGAADLRLESFRGTIRLVRVEDGKDKSDKLERRAEKLERKAEKLAKKKEDE